MEPVDLVWVIDISKSMGRGQDSFKPSKLSAAKEAVAYASSRLLEVRGSRVGIVLFHGRALPVLHLTDSLDMVISTLAMVKTVGEGSAGGDAIVEAVKMLRLSGRRRRAVMLTDAGFNTGIPVDVAAIYARNSEVRVDAIILSSRPGEQGLRALSEVAKATGGVVRQASSPDELFKVLMEVLGLGEPG